MKPLNLYDIASNLMELAEGFAMAETDEEIQAFFDTMEGEEMEFEEKVTNYCKLIRNFELTSDAIAAEVDRLNKRKKMFAGAGDRLRDRIKEVFEALGKKKMKNDLFTVSYGERDGGVEIDEDAWDNIPPSYWEAQDPKLNKGELKKAIKAGEEIPGVRIARINALTIR